MVEMTATHATGSAFAGLELDHLGVATRDLDDGSAPYRALGLEALGPDEAVPSQGVIVRAFRAGGALVELLAPTTPESPLHAFLERRGPGVHHVAFRVADLDASVARLRADGAAFASDTPRPGRAGTRVVFLHPRWGAGTLIELVEHAP